MRGHSYNRRHYAQRPNYPLLIVVLGIEIWRGMIHDEKPWALMQEVFCCE
jgi:hypothetical protein